MRSNFPPDSRRGQPRALSLRKYSAVSQSSYGSQSRQAFVSRDQRQVQDLGSGG